MSWLGTCRPLVAIPLESAGTKLAWIQGVNAGSRTCSHARAVALGLLITWRQEIKKPCAPIYLVILGLPAPWWHRFKFPGSRLARFPWSLGRSATWNRGRAYDLTAWRRFSMKASDRGTEGTIKQEMSPPWLLEIEGPGHQGNWKPWTQGTKVYRSPGTD